MLDIVRDFKNLNDYFYVKYYLESKTTLLEAAMALSIGQSIGNPNLRSKYETLEMVENHCAKIIRNDNLTKSQGEIEIGFPLRNFDWSEDGIAQLLCVIMGGQTDIDIILKCRALKLEFDEKFILENFKKPNYGLTGFRKYTNTYDKMLLGGILKPKIGGTPQILLDMTKELVDGGCQFIKEDECMANPAIAPLKERVELISRYISNTNVIYCFCINADPTYIIPRAKFIADNGGNGLHINVWSGLGAYKAIRDSNLGLFCHFQKSGDKAFTHKNNPFSLSWQLICQIATMSGCDSIHAGMWGGYLSDPEDELRETLKILTDGNVTPSLSCGLTAELIQPIAEKFGVDLMASAGGGIHSHPEGSTAGARKIRNAIDSL